MTDPLGQSQVIPYLSGLTKYGYSFVILSCDRPERYSVNKKYVDKLLEAVPVQWVSIPYHKKPAVLSSLYDFYALKRTAKELHAKHGFDMVHTRPGLPSLTGIYLRNKLGIKFLNDIRGFWADERVEGGIWNIKNPVLNKVYQFFKRHEKDCLDKADYSVCLTYKAKEIIHRRDDITDQPVPVEVIPCSVDMDLFNANNIDASLKASLKEALNIDDGDCIISYLGSIGGWYLTDEMMRFCKMVSDKISRAKFLFISPDSHDVIVAAAAKAGLVADKLILTKAQRHEVPVLLSFSSYSIFFIKPCYSKLASSPTKHGEIMAMGIPVITNSGVGDVAEIVNNYNAGYVLDDFSAAAMNVVVEKLVTNNSFDKTAIRNGAKEIYALENAVEKYSRVYSTILS